MHQIVRACPLLLAALICFPFFAACDDDDTYADRRKKENQQIQGFLVTGAQVMDDDAGEYILNIPGNIKVISEQEFYANDSTTDVEKNEYVRFGRTGVYMQIVRKGTGRKLADGEKTNVLMRYVEFDIAKDSIKTTNRTTLTSNIDPDVMNCENNYGTFTASFVSGVMKTFYQTSSVPAGWLIPLTYINLGRHTSEEGIAKVRLIVPSDQGQSDASNNVYPCFYEITYMRGRTVNL